MGAGDDFVVINRFVLDDIDGGSGNDSICLAGYTAANWTDIESWLTSFENIKTSDETIVKGSSDTFGEGCEYSDDWGGGYQYSYPVTLTISAAVGFDAVVSITLINDVMDTEVSGVVANDDGSYTLMLDDSHQVQFTLLSDVIYDAGDLITIVSSEWELRKQKVTVTLKLAD